LRALKDAPVTVPEKPPGAGATLFEAAGAGFTVFDGADDEEVAFGVGAALGAFVAAGMGPLRASILCVDVICGGVMARTAPRLPKVPHNVIHIRFMRKVSLVTLRIGRETSHYFT